MGELKHFGTKGMTWYKRHYQDYDTVPTRSGKVGEYLGEKYKHEKTDSDTKKVVGGNAKKDSNKEDRDVVYNSKHVDRVLNKDKDILSVKSYDKDQLKRSYMFYATVNTKPDKTYKLNVKLKKDVKVASEDSSTGVFSDLYKKDKAFNGFVNNRMDSYLERHLGKEKYELESYREGRDALRKMTDPSYTPSRDDFLKVHRLFNCVVSYDGGHNSKRAEDMLKQRTKFFNALNDKGYGALVDTDNAIYGNFKKESPILVFDMAQVVPPEDKKSSLPPWLVGKRIDKSELKHSGVKGQRWYHRYHESYKSKPTRSGKVGEEHFSQMGPTKEELLSPSHGGVKNPAEAARNISSELSDAELRSLVNRLQSERQLRKLSSDIDRGNSKTRQFLDTAKNTRLDLVELYQWYVLGRTIYQEVKRYA